MIDTMVNLITEVPGPKSRELTVRKNKIIARGVSNSTGIFVKNAKGAIVEDVDGNMLIDMAAGIGVTNIGYGDEDVIKAAKEQLDRFTHTSINVLMYEPYVEVAEKLASLTPGTFDKKVMFVNSGSEAVENAVKIARKYTKKSMIISLEAAFHGRTYMAMTLTSKVKPYKYGYAPYCSDTFKIPTPYYYRSDMHLSEEEYGIQCAEKFADLLKGELNPEFVAGLIVEPLQGEGGFILPPKGYLKRLQEICHENNIVFIVDEIQAGFCRTGKFFCSEHHGIEPDIITVSKAIAGGLPLSAVVGKSEMMESCIPGGLGGTFAGNPVALAAANVVIDKMSKENFSQKAAHIGEVMMLRLLSLKDKYEIVGDVRGKGAMLAMELVLDKKSKTPNPEAVGKIISYCLKKGVVLISAGIYSNCIRFLPPLVLDDTQLLYVLDTLDEAFSHFDFDSIESQTCNMQEV